MKTVAEIAKALDGLEYGRAFPPDDIVREAKAAGIVICSGASDDLFEAYGAFRDETGAPGTICFDPDGCGLLLQECDNDRCPHEARRRKTAPQVALRWHDKDGPCWTFETAIPHEKFRLMEDGEVFCEGIVFAVDAITRAPKP